MSRLAVLGLGGNIGDAQQNIAKAIALIEEQIGQIDAQSSMYETGAWGVEDQPNFVNAVVGVRTKLEPLDLLAKCLAIEKQLGRVRIDGEKWTERIMDIDILYFEDEQISHPDLIVPHPHLTDRKFVLMPLAEIYPNFKHPILDKPTLDLLNRSKDEGRVKKI